LETALRYDREVLKRLCRERRVKRLDLFGSRAKGIADGESDVDLLVEFEPGHTPGLLGFIEFEEELAALFGERVDLVYRYNTLRKGQRLTGGSWISDRCRDR
jgi:predicted nucleotidyltransferase